MADYIRGKKAYTKWDADTDNVDMDLSPDSPQPRIHMPPTGWFSGTKGKVLRALIVGSVFLLGLILGYLMRRGVHEVVKPHQLSMCSPHTSLFAFENKYSEFLQKEVSKERLLNWLRKMTTDHHIGGDPKGEDLAKEIAKEWKSYGLENVRTEKYQPLLSYINDQFPNRVRLISRKGVIHETTLGVTDEALRPRPYSGYSPKGYAKGKPVYCGYGLPENFEYFRHKGISLNGTIAIIRNGRINRQNKVLLAAQQGVSAILLFSDPINNSSQYPTYPDGLGLPGDAVERGNLKAYPGDPLTPFLPATEGMYRIPESEASLPSIPVQPISYNDAYILLKDMNGLIAPVEWQGKINLTYCVGPGYNTSDNREVEVIVNNTLKMANIFNVIGVIPGNFEPGRYVIVGCHHDAWTEGAGDPGTGMAALMELARIFGDMKNEGWRPGRTLIFASWDAEEFGMVGSTEWVQEHAKELFHRTVAYINLDQAVSGNSSLEVIGSPLLRQALKEATEVVPCHEITHTPMSVYDMWIKKRQQSSNNIKSGPPISLPGSGSDFVSFLSGLGITAAHLQFVSKDPVTDYPPYHTACDTLDAIVNFTDPGLHALTTITKIVGVLLLKLTDSVQVPMNPKDYSNQINENYEEFNKSFGDAMRKNCSIDTNPLSEAVEQFQKAACGFHDNFNTVDRHSKMMAYQQYNDRLLELERSFLLPQGYPHHKHFRHVIYGPDSENNYKGVLFPHLVKAIRDLQKDHDHSRCSYVNETQSLVIHSLRSASYILNSPFISSSQ